MTPRFIIVAIALILCFLPAFPSAAQTLRADRNSVKAEEIEIDAGGVRIKISDVVLSDQDGRIVRFYSDLIKNKVVVLTFFYTSCTYTCQMQGKIFSQLQLLLRERLGKSVFLISVTNDPLKDDPQRLQVWGERYKRKSGWTLVTGEKVEVNKLLLGFTGSRAGGGPPHLPSIFIGNDKTGVWSSAVGIFDAEELIKVIDHLSAEDLPKRK